MSKCQTKKLGDICDIQSGGTPSRSKNEYWVHGTIPWVKISDINSKFINKTEELITEFGLENSSAKIFTKGTIIYTIFATIGEVAILNCNACTNQAIAGIKILNNNVSTEYLYHYLVHKKEEVKALSRGVAQNNINLTLLRALEIDIPVASEQKMKSEVLNKVCSIIEARKIQLLELDKLAKSRFIEMFGDISNNSKNIEISTLGKECIIISGGTPRTGNDEYWDGNIKWITPAEINETERTIYDTERHITEKGRRSAHLEIMPKGTVLLSSRAPIGKLAIAGNEMTCNQGFKNLIPNDKLTSIFLYYYLKGIIPEIQSLGRGATFKEISKTIVSDIKILVPPKSKQLAFSSLVEQLDKSKFRMKKCLKLLSYIRHL